jgi:SAM-dependent methyltransferase
MKITSKAEKIFFEIHSDNLREGPGNFESTGKAFSFITGLPKEPVILDIGCGPGQQTLDLATLSPARIFAIDLHSQYLNQLLDRIIKNQFRYRIFPLRCDMKFLPFLDNSFDVIWGEGSIYLIGFKKGLKLLKPFLRSGGYLAVSEVSWLRENPPDELKKFWLAGYPALNTIPGNLTTIEKSGFRLINYFVLPDSAWWEDYYGPLEVKISGLIEKYRDDPVSLNALKAEEVEMDLFQHYSEYYGYVFYVMQKP